MLDALARVLCLDAPERRHLFALAGVPLPAAPGPIPVTAPPELAAIVEGLLPLPAYLLTPRTDVLAWNASARAMLGAPTCAPDGSPNLLWWLFTEPGGQAVEARRTTARQTLARFRAAHARHYGDAGFAGLVEALLVESAWFRELWHRHEVLDHQVGTKHVDHAELGPLVVHHLQSIPTSHPELRLVQFVPADDATRSAFATTDWRPPCP